MAQPSWCCVVDTDRFSQQSLFHCGSSYIRSTQNGPCNISWTHTVLTFCPAWAAAHHPSPAIMNVLLLLLIAWWSSGNQATLAITSDSLIQEPWTLQVELAWQTFLLYLISLMRCPIVSTYISNLNIQVFWVVFGFTQNSPWACGTGLLTPKIPTFIS